MSQPWDFILIDDQATKLAFWDHVEEQRRVFADTLDAARSSLFARIKIDGVRESTLSIVVSYDQDRGAPGVLGRHSIADAGLYSVCLAIENLWLAATAEGWGVGWVSFYEESFLGQLLGLPGSVRPVAWLCIGPVSELASVPDLERKGWRARRPLEDMVHDNQWGQPCPTHLAGSSPG